jgi:single stranded DNA-binding protein
MRSDAFAWIVGHLGSDARVSTTPSGATVATITVAINRKIRDGKKTLWVRAEVWNPRDDLLAQLKKGTYVRVVGSLFPEQYTDKQGTYHDTFKLQSANVIVLVDQRRDEEPLPAEATIEPSNGFDFDDEDEPPF